MFTRSIKRFAAVSLALLLVVTFSVSVSAAPKKMPKVRGAIETIGPKGNEITVLYLKGSAYERGYAHGVLCKEKVRSFLSLLKEAMLAAMKTNENVLDKAYAAMEPYIPQEYKEEMKGLADGAGVSLRLVHQVHAIPDLSEFHCTFVAATHKATHDGHTYQLRALDYETKAHIQDQPAIIISQPHNGVAFVNVGWCGFIGVVTGCNRQKIAMSEIGDHFSDAVETLKAEPMIFVMRDVVENARSMKQAIKIVREAKRTSSFLYALSDGKNRELRALVTCKDFCKVYDDETLPLPFPILKDVVYMSMGWDSKWNKRVYKVLAKDYGRIDQNTIIKNISCGLGTGNLQSVVFDMTDMKMWVANAGKDGTPAFKRTFVKVDLRELFRKLNRVH